MALKEATKKYQFTRNSKLGRERKMMWVFPAAELNQWTPNPSRLFNFLHFSHTKAIHNRKLNFCSVWVSQEAFLPHVNGMAARHFWKKTTILIKRLSVIKSVQVINETGCRQKSNKNDASYSKGKPVNTPLAFQSSMNKAWQKKKS